MGKVMTVMKVFPEEGQAPDQLAERVRQVKGCVKAEVVEYVFGAKVVQASFVCDDNEGVDYEEIVRKVEGVSEVQVEEVGLIS